MKRLALRLLLPLSVIVYGLIFFSVINRTAVNILYYDQWDYYKPLFEGHGPLGFFNLQHGPHRMGLGGIIIGVLANLTHWNTRADAFAVGVSIALALAAMLGLRQRLGGELTVADAVLPAIFFNLSQIESLAIIPNPAHGAVPLLLAMLWLIAWTLPNRTVSYATVLVLNLFLVYTGFGFFFGVITPVLLAVEVYRHRFAPAPIVAFVVSGITLALFFHGWTFVPAIPCFEFPHPHPFEYLQFMVLMLARFLGFVTIGAFAYLVGSLILIALIAVVVLHAIRLVRDRERDDRSLAIVALGTWTLLFCANAAVGRVCAGIDGALNSRYATLVMPAFLALFLHLASFARPALRKWALPAFAAIVVLLPFLSIPREIAFGEQYAIGKRAWRDCYLDAHSITPCDLATQFSVYPTPTIGQKLEFLEKNKLNFFAK